MVVVLIELGRDREVRYGLDLVFDVFDILRDLLRQFLPRPWASTISLRRARLLPCAMMHSGTVSTRITFLK